MKKSSNWKDSAREEAENFLKKRQERGKSGSCHQFRNASFERRAARLGVDPLDLPIRKPRDIGIPLYYQALDFLGLVCSNRDLTASQYLILAFVVSEYLKLWGVVSSKYYHSAIMPVLICEGTKRNHIIHFCKKERRPMNITLFPKQLKATRKVHTLLVPSMLRYKIANDFYNHTGAIL